MKPGDLYGLFDDMVRSLPTLQVCQDFCRTYHHGGGRLARMAETEVEREYHGALFDELRRRGVIWDIHFSPRKRSLLTGCLEEAARTAEYLDSRRAT